MAMAFQQKGGREEGLEPGRRVTNGAALAAFLAAGFGCFAMGAVVVLNETGVFTSPTLYGPAGGVSGRTTFAVAAWLVAWFLLHLSFRNRHLHERTVYIFTILLIVLGLIGTFPPVWEFLP